MAGRPGSLRGRLLAIAGVACALSWLAGAAAMFTVVQRGDMLLFDARLQDIANTLLVFADHELAEVAALGGDAPVYIDTDGTAAGRYRYQIWSRGGRLVLSSHNAPTDRPLMPLAQRGLATLTIAGEAVRVVTIDSPTKQYLIQAAEPLSRRLELNDIFNRYLGLGVMLSALALALTSLLLARLALQPLRRATEEIGRRGPADLRAVEPTQLPREIAPVLQAVNRLMQRVDVALRSERHFVAAAAHELRTPLAGLRAQAELAAHPRTDARERGQALQAVLEGVDHAAHLVGQLLDLARSDALAGDPARLSAERETVDVRAVFEAAMDELGPQAAARELRIEQRFEVPSLVGTGFAIGLILRNLLANAVAHAPQGGLVAVGTRASPGGTVLWVADNGPGVPPAERERLFERFYRGPGNEQPGCGLGLSIVKALADAHRARVTLGSAEIGGLLVELTFAAPVAD